MADNTIITLTTDFGTQDGFVGAMKGVILSINSKAIIVDITHEIQAQDIFGAALSLRNSCRSFPKGSIHVAVVDPGVGGSRKPLLLQTDTHFYVGPDNGIFSFVTEVSEIVRIIELTEQKYFLTPVSNTFHGRDIFAPVAAYLSQGVDPDEFGTNLKSYVTIRFPKPIGSEEGIEGEVVHVDRFGNLITNIDRDLFEQRIGEKRVWIEVGQEKLDKVSLSYSEVGEDFPLAIFGSSGLLEISVNRGNAQKELGMNRSDTVRVRFI